MQIICLNPLRKLESWHKYQGRYFSSSFHLRYHDVHLLCNWKEMPNRVYWTTFPSHCFALHFSVMPPASLQSQSNMETIRGSIWDKLSCTEWQEAQGRGLLRARECIHLKNAVDCRCMRKHVTIVDSCVHSDVWFRSLLITLAGYLRCLRKPTPADEAWSFLEWCSATDCSLGVSACACLSSWEGGCNFFQPWAPTRSVFTALSWTSEWQLWKQVNLWQFDTQQ